MRLVWELAARTAASASLDWQPGRLYAEQLPCSLSRAGASGAAGSLLKHTHCLAAGAAGGATLGSTAVPLCALSRFDLGVWALPPFMEGFLHPSTQCSRCFLTGHSTFEVQRGILIKCSSLLPQAHVSTAAL